MCTGVHVRALFMYNFPSYLLLIKECVYVYEYCFITLRHLYKGLLLISFSVCSFPHFSSVIINGKF